MPRRKYDARHERMRTSMLRAWQPGDVCCRCGHEIHPTMDKLHADHSDDGSGYLGLAHASPCRVCGQKCNLAAGGRRSAQLAGKQLRSRRCAICGTPYEAARGRTSAVQQTCGRQECITELQARNRTREPLAPAPDITGRVW